MSSSGVSVVGKMREGSKKHATLAVALVGVWKLQ